MLKNFFQGRVEDASTTTRLKEMVNVLRKREVMGGMTPGKLRAVLEDLGPTFVKLGQVMSMRPDFLPPEYCEELMKLQTEALPLPFETIAEVIEQEYSCRWQKVFSYIDEKALGSASIAQVHRGTLVSGEKVAIKVQRPDSYQMMEQDIRLLKRALNVLKLKELEDKKWILENAIDETWRVAKEEMDFIKEAMQQNR